MPSSHPDMQPRVQLEQLGLQWKIKRRSGSYWLNQWEQCNELRVEGRQQRWESVTQPSRHIWNIQYMTVWASLNSNPFSDFIHIDSHKIFRPAFFWNTTCPCSIVNWLLAFSTQRCLSFSRKIKREELSLIYPNFAPVLLNSNDQWSLLDPICGHMQLI